MQSPEPSIPVSPAPPGEADRGDERPGRHRGLPPAAAALRRRPPAARGTPRGRHEAAEGVAHDVDAAGSEFNREKK